MAWLHTLEVSGFPNDNSPFNALPSVGSNEMPMDSVDMVFWENRLSVTVGTDVVLVTVPREKNNAFRTHFLLDMTVVLLTSRQINRANSTRMREVMTCAGHEIETTNPRIPSTSWNPVAFEATPID
jgi:hypothetical protein